jgi:hypothetical protein
MSYLEITSCIYVFIFILIQYATANQNSYILNESNYTIVAKKDKFTWQCVYYVNSCIKNYTKNDIIEYCEISEIFSIFLVLLIAGVIGPGLFCLISYCDSYLYRKMIQNRFPNSLNQSRYTEMV